MENNLNTLKISKITFNKNMNLFKEWILNNQRKWIEKGKLY